jgi:hypothetical protein
MKSTLFFASTLLWIHAMAKPLTPITTTPRNVMAKAHIMGLRSELGFMPYKDRQGFLFVSEN